MQRGLSDAQCQRTNIAYQHVVTLLQELWLQHNQIASHSQLSALSTLPSLAVLFLNPNPLCDSLKAEHRAATVHALPSLQVILCRLC